VVNTPERDDLSFPFPRLPPPLSLFTFCVFGVYNHFSIVLLPIRSFKSLLFLFCVCHRLVFSWFLSDLKNFLMLVMISDLFVCWWSLLVLVLVFGLVLRLGLMVLFFDLVFVLSPSCWVLVLVLLLIYWSCSGFSSRSWS
jgi:hypothetical protein